MFDYQLIIMPGMHERELAPTMLELPGWKYCSVQKFVQPNGLTDIVYLFCRKQDGKA